MVKLQTTGDWRAINTGPVTEGREGHVSSPSLPPSRRPAALKLVLYRALGWGVRMTVTSVVMSMTQCSAWMPIPHSWMS